MGAVTPGLMQIASVFDSLVSQFDKKACFFHLCHSLFCPFSQQPLKRDQGEADADPEAKRPKNKKVGYF